MSLNMSGNVPSIAGAFTPLWSAAGGLLGPAFMPGSRRDRKPKRASPKVAIHRRLAEPKTNRGSIRPRRPVGFVGSLCLGRHPKSRVHQPVLKHGPKKQRGVNAPRLASMNSSSPKQIQLLWQDGNPAPRLFQWSPVGLKTQHREMRARKQQIAP